MRTGAGALATLERVMRVGVLIPATLACAAVADLALRALPHDRFSFRAWEAVRTPGEDAPFLPNTRYHNDRTYGNLSAIGNIPAARRYRSVTLTTDALGYANPPGLGAPGGGGGRGGGGAAPATGRSGGPSPRAPREGGFCPPGPPPPPSPPRGPSTPAP